MPRLVFTVVAAGALTVGALGNACVAAAAPTGGSAVDGMTYGPLSKCMVENVRGPSGTPTLPGRFDLAYVDIVCSSSNG